MPTVPSEATALKARWYLFLGRRIGLGARIDQSHRLVVDFHEIDRHRRNLFHIKSDLVQAGSQQNQGLAVFTLLDAEYPCDSIRVRRIASQAPYGVRRIQDHTAFLKNGQGFGHDFINAFLGHLAKLIS